MRTWLSRLIGEPGLARDFWLFQAGQLISTIGDACGNIALAWWILDVTGSADAVSWVLAPAILVQTLLTPILGPLGDRLSRRRLIAGADVVRGALMLALAGLAAARAFSIPAVLAVYLPFVAASALFSSSNMSIVPELVPPHALQAGVRASESLLAVGRVLGGVVAGILVSVMGVAPAFVVDALSFGVAAAATAAILVGRTRPTQEVGAPRPAPARFLHDLRGGFRVIYRVPVLFWLGIAVAFFNLVLSPMQVLLPTYAKLAKGMPAWFLGGLESSMGLGIVAGAAGIALIERLARLAPSVMIGLMLLGGGMAVLPRAPGVTLPLLAMFLVGVGAAWTNIPIGTRVSVAVPDRFRSRVTSIIAFFFDGTAPVGVAAAGSLVAAVGVAPAMTGLGTAVLLLLPVLYWIPGLAEFFRRSPAELTDHFLIAYPRAFQSRAAPE